MSSDFNGDGRDDILWRNTVTGQISNWLGESDGGFFINDGAALFTASTSTQVIAIGDFDGDSFADLLLRNVDNGVIGVRLGTPSGAFTLDSNFSRGGFGNEVDVAWTVLGAGDFNGDGRDDLLWRNTQTGAISNWLGSSNGDWVVNDAAALTTALASENFVGIGDFNGDGRDDIVTVFNSGSVGSYTLSFVLPNGALEPEDPFTGFGIPLDWQIAGVGDFNGDGRDDLLWRNSVTGAVSNWLYAGGLGTGTFLINDAVAMRQVPNNWNVVDVADYNGDGRDDILWRNADTGALSDWLGIANGGFAINDAAALTIVSTQWLVQPNPSGAGEWDY